MDARLNTFNDELCQENTHVGCIARRQVAMGGYTVASSPSPPTSEDEDDDGDANASDADEDDDASSSSADEMST